MDTLQIFARFLFNLPLCHSMWQALWPNHQMLLWPERYRTDKPEKRLDGTRVLGTAAGAMNRGLWTRCKLQKCRRDTKKIAITIWQSPKKKRKKKPSNLLKHFGIFCFSTLQKIQIKRAKCANCCEWISMRVGASYDSTYPVKGRQCMPTAARVSLGWAHWFSLATIECAHKVLCILWAQMSSRTSNWQRITKAKG